MEAIIGRSGVVDTKRFDTSPGLSRTIATKQHGSWITARPQFVSVGKLAGLFEIQDMPRVLTMVEPWTWLPAVGQP